MTTNELATKFGVQMESLLCINDLSVVIRRSVRGIYQAVWRGDDSIPPGFRIGRKLYWDRAAVRAWISETQSRNAIARQQPPMHRHGGRPRMPVT